MVQCGLTLLIPSPSVTSIERVIPKTSSLISAPICVDRAEIRRIGEDEKSRAGPRHTPLSRANARGKKSRVRWGATTSVSLGSFNRNFRQDVSRAMPR